MNVRHYAKNYGRYKDRHDFYFIDADILGQIIQLKTETSNAKQNV